jgi:diketogulonate reductase-like aldo/keto reductase
MDPTSTLTLNDARAIPRLGLGVFRSGAGKATQDAVRWALEAGYRHIDTAHIYGNEADVGKALRASGLPREQVFVTTKLWNDDQGYEQTLRAFDMSLATLGTDYVDLYLMHWPVPERRLHSWRAMEQLVERGHCRSIGVSNFVVRHLKELLHVGNVVPAVNQIELHPFLQQPETVAFCRANAIAVEAYSPLTKGRRLDHPALGAVAREVGRSPAQVLIRWSLQHGFVVLPKSAKRARVLENAAVFDFELGPDQLARLDALDENLHTAWDPTDAP